MQGHTTTMIRRSMREGADTRFVFRLYAAATIVAGLNITGTGIRGLPGVSLHDASLIWIAGMIIVAAGCAATGLSLNDDPAGRRYALYWFATGHVLLGLIVWMQWGTYWGAQGLPQAVALAPLIAGVVLLAAATSSRPRDAAHGELSPAQRIGSTYDEHIRAIARREERARLARDLHDAVKQQLFVIQTAAATAQTRFDSDAAGALDALTDVRTAAREATTEMQALLDELQAAPMENTGLVEAVKKQCEALALRTGAVVSFQPGALAPVGALAPGAHEAIYRVAQEALANVARHARATRVTVALQATATHFELRVADNGSGFDGSARRPGMGIRNMETRAAEIGGQVSVVAASPGTEVVLQVPLTNAAIRTAWFSVGIFGMAALGYAVFYGVRGSSPDQRFWSWCVGLSGAYVVWRLVTAYARRRHPRPQ